MGTYYCKLSDVNRYLENFQIQYYGTDATGSTNLYADMESAYDRINEELDAIQRFKTIPIGTQADGKYPASLIEWNSKLTIWNKLKARHGKEWEEEAPRWIQDFSDDCDTLRSDIIVGNVVFQDELSLAESGIAIPTYAGSYATQSGLASFHSNYQVGKYRGSDFERYFRIAIDGTVNGNDIGKATFKWSMDDGVSSEDTAVSTGTNWIGLTNGLAVRWEGTTLIGTQVQVDLGDAWRIRCVPMNIQAYGHSGIAKHKQFVRG